MKHIIILAILLAFTGSAWGGSTTYKTGDGSCYVKQETDWGWFRVFVDCPVEPSCQELRDRIEVLERNESSTIPSGMIDDGPIPREIYKKWPDTPPPCCQELRKDMGALEMDIRTLKINSNAFREFLLGVFGAEVKP